MRPKAPENRLTPLFALDFSELGSNVFRSSVMVPLYCSWLVDTIMQHYEKINLRVTKDVAQQKEKEEKEKEARKQRLEKLRALQNHADNANGSAVDANLDSSSQGQLTSRNSPNLMEDIDVILSHSARLLVFI